MAESHLVSYQWVEEDMDRKAADPSTDPGTLSQLFRMCPEPRVSVLLRNPNLSLSHLERAVHRREVWENPAWQLAMLSDPDLGPRALQQALMPGMAQHPPSSSGPPPVVLLLPHHLPPVGHEGPGIAA